MPTVPSLPQLLNNLRLLPASCFCPFHDATPLLIDFTWALELIWLPAYSANLSGERVSIRLGIAQGSCNMAGFLFLSGSTDRSGSEGFGGDCIIGVGLVLDVFPLNWGSFHYARFLSPRKQLQRGEEYRLSYDALLALRPQWRFNST